MTNKNDELPNVICLCATCGRHTLMERSLRLFLEQDYEGKHTLLIHNNSEIPLKFIDLRDLGLIENNKHVYLWNSHIDPKTNKPYKTLGEIYNSELGYVQSLFILEGKIDFINMTYKVFDIVTHWDDDDLFLPNHISEGVKGYLRAKEEDKLAYKPKQSWYRHAGGLTLLENNLEPSVFVDFDFLKETGYSDTTTEQHLQWYGKLGVEDKILIDPKGIPTLIYNWGDSVNDTTAYTFKTSGDCSNPENFNNYRKYSRDHGDKILTPWDKKDVQKYYDLVATSVISK
jgi:hypothetical protein